MDLEERKKLIAQYRDGYAAVTAVLLKITPEELDAKPAPGQLVGARDRPPSRRQRNDGRGPAAAAARARIGRRSTATTRTSSRARCTTTGRTRRRSSCSAGARESTAELLELSDAGRMAARGHAHRGRAVRRRDVAEDLCRPRAQARAPDPRGAGARRSREPADQQSAIS